MNHGDYMTNIRSHVQDHVTYASVYISEQHQFVWSFSSPFQSPKKRREKKKKKSEEQLLLQQ